MTSAATQLSPSWTLRNRPVPSLTLCNKTLTGFYGASDTSACLLDSGRLVNNRLATASRTLIALSGRHRGTASSSRYVTIQHSWSLPLPG